MTNAIYPIWSRFAQNFDVAQFIARCPFRLLAPNSSNWILKESSSELLKIKMVDSAMNEMKYYFSCSNISGKQL